MSVLVCIFAGSLVMSLQHYFGAQPRANPKLFLPLMALAIAGVTATLVLVNRPWPTEGFGQRLVTLMLCAYGALFVGWWVQQLSGVGKSDVSIWRIVIASLSFQGAGLVLIARFLVEHQITWSEGFGLSNRWRRAVLLGVMVALIFLPVGWALQQASAFVMTHLPHFKLQPEEQLPVHVLRLSASWAGRITLGAVAILLAPIAEEILFRGILYPAIKQAGYPQLALWGTVLLFAFVHMNAATFVPLAVLALFLTALYERTDNLIGPIVAHALFNALNFATLLVIEQT